MKKQQSFRDKLNIWFFGFHQEVIKTSIIGKKMLTASRTNAYLKETYEELGKLVEKEIDENRLEWHSKKAETLLNTIKACQKDLNEIEQKIQKIKFSAGPEDISKKINRD